MSTFLGQINEIPGISVDRFDGLNIESSVYFLSHCHTDHMQGLSSNFFWDLKRLNRFLYCSPITKVFLLGIYWNVPEDRIIELELTIPKTIYYKVPKDGKIEETSLTVTTSPAGHCPGAVMLIFEKGEQSILYTGDFRINPKDLPKLNPLNNQIDGKNWPKKFAAVYLDTTFLSPNFPYFPSRKESCEEICEAIKNWLQTDQKNIVILECSGNYGPEYLFMEIANLLKIKIHAKDGVYLNYARIEELSQCVTRNGKSARIHACTTKMTREQLFCRSDVSRENMLTIVPSVLRWTGKNLEKFTEIDPLNNRRLYVCYSMHSSYNELKEFVDYFKPDKIIPCVCPSNSAYEIEQMLRELMGYQKRSVKVEEKCTDVKVAVPTVNKMSRKKFKSEYFLSDVEDD